MLTGLSSSPAAAVCAPQLLSSVLSAAGLLSTRGVSVLSWGRNTEHQCGIEGQQALVTQPTAVLELLQQHVTAIAAGRSTSAAILRGEEVHVWGDGACGKLGLGSGESAACPSRVEAFVGRSSIKRVVLGHQHSLFLDSAGCCWAAGENKEGQCGLGTPLAQLAWQHRQAWEDAMMRAGMQRWQAHRQFDGSSNVHQQHLRSAGAAAAAAGGVAPPHIAHGWGTLFGEGSSSSSSRYGGADSWRLPQADASTANTGSNVGSSSRRRGGGSRVGASGDLWGGRGGSASPWGSHFGGSSGSSGSSWGYLMGQDAQAHMQALQMQPGQVHTPVRVGGGSAHSLFMQQQEQQESEEERELAATKAAAELEAASEANTSSSASSSGGVGVGDFSQEQVVGMAAGKYFSVAVTAKGEVFTCGASFDGVLGSEEGSSWQPSPTRVSDALSAAIAAHGGAVAVAAGSTFAAALTASGRVLVWGKLVMNSSSTASSMGGMRMLSGLHGPSGAGAADRSSEDGDSAGSSDSDGRRQGWVEVGLPQGVKVEHIAAGQQHLLMSDGERVWAVGRWMDAAGQEAGCAGAQAPVEVLACPDAGIVKISAGMHSSAVVDGAGRLWVWGRLLDPHTAQALVQQRMVLSVGGGSGGGGYGSYGSVGGRAGATATAAAALYQAADAAKRLRQLDWSWAGYGGAEPKLVEGLVGVRDVALGGWHALVLVD